MESERLVINKELSLYIGTPKQPKKSPKKQQKFKVVGDKRKVYGVVLDGMEHEYFFRMPLRRRKELMQRILKGQNFCYTPWLQI